MASNPMDITDMRARWGAKVCSGPKRRERKPSIRTMIAQAEKSGKTVANITTPDGYTIKFGQPSPAKHNSWDDLEETGTPQ
jgi:hypothetical protein